MKRTLLILLLLNAVLISLSAGNAELFSYNRAVINEEFEQLTVLENYIFIHHGITSDELIAVHSDLSVDLNTSEMIYGGTKSAGGEDAMGVPSFIWGCCFGIVGILAVYLDTEDPKEIKKAIYGTLTQLTACVALYGIFYGLISILSYNYYY